MNASGFAEALRYVCRRGVLRRNLLIALVVGTILSAANQWDVVLREPMSARLGVKIFFNLLIPFIVSSISAALNRRG